MDHTRTRRTRHCRRISSAGAVIAIVAVSSAFGIGATAATAAEPVPTTSPAVQPPTVTETEPPATTATDEPAPVTDTTAPATGTDPSPTTPTEPETETDPTDPATQPEPVPSPVVAERPAPEQTAPEQTAPADQGSTATPAGTVTITGTSKRMHTLTAETSGWPAGTTFTYQWLHSFDGAAPTEQPGDTTKRTFVIGSLENDLDRYAVRVTGTAPGAEPTSVVSDLSAPVAEAPENRWGYLGVRTITITANEPTTQALAAFDGDGLSYYVSGSASGPTEDVLPRGLRVAADGTLSGTPTGAGITEFWLHTSSGPRPDGAEVSQVRLIVAPGATTALGAVVRGSGTWLVHPDGSTTYSESSEVAAGDPATPLKVRTGEQVTINPRTFDQNGDLTTDERLPSWSSSVSSDVVDPTGTSWADSTLVRFEQPGVHRITLRLGDLSLTFAVQVDPAPAPVVVTKTGSTTSGNGTGQLAYTGADESGPLAWALGLIASGVGLVLVRLRRRRA